MYVYILILTRVLDKFWILDAFSIPIQNYERKRKLSRLLCVKEKHAFFPLYTHNWLRLKSIRLKLTILHVVDKKYTPMMHDSFCVLSEVSALHT